VNVLFSSLIGARYEHFAEVPVRKARVNLLTAALIITAASVDIVCVGISVTGELRATCARARGGVTHHNRGIAWIDLSGYHGSGYACDRGAWSFCVRRDFLKRSKTRSFWRLRRQMASGVW